MTKYDNQSKDQQMNHELILNLSHENLSVSQSNIKQGFNKQSMCWHIVSRHTILNICTIILILSCIFFQVFELPKVLENNRNIETIKRDLEALQRQFYKVNFLTEFEAFEKQLYEDEDMSGDDVDVDENDDYDYDDEDYESDVYNKLNEEKINFQIISTTLSSVIENGEKISYNITQFNHTNNEKLDTNVRENNTGIAIDRLAATSDSKHDLSIMNRSTTTGQPLADFKNSTIK
ncbi:hypothetical protein PV327_010036 [Microctonus hyperodae]|uniref:Transmembrane protein n=1 Tax=Microctonus hyperodae TaxID=165561 RepID=A0AA39F282_MICHY|nr:hypothetical protein PV327_010036 [Microctonus hyperodae]